MTQNLLKSKMVTFSILILFAFSFVFTQTIFAKIKDRKIEGYITNFISPTSFEIEDFKIIRTNSTVLIFENQVNNEKFNPDDLRFGTEVEVQGSFNDETNELTANKIKIDLDQFKKITNTTILSDAPTGIEKVENGWKGIFWGDGRQIRIEPTTQVLFELNKVEKKQAEEEAKNKKDKKKDGKDEIEGKTYDDDFNQSEPLKSVADVKAGMFATYEGIEQPDGTLLASRIVFMKNPFEKGEEKLWKSLKLTEKAANLVEGKPGELKIDQIGKFKLLANDEVQQYVQRVGESLIPKFQKALADDSPQKIHFKFYVVNNKEPNAFATPNGIVVVHSGMIALLENEAQLAAVISHEISHATQEHTWRQLNKDKNTKTALMIGGIAASLLGFGAVSDILQLTYGAMVNGYSRRLENQADRIGLEYMAAAGYDPREAPRVWKIMSKKYGDMPDALGFFWASHSSNATRRSYLMNAIRNNYSNLNYSEMKRGEEVYKNIVALTIEAQQKKKK